MEYFVASTAGAYPSGGCYDIQHNDTQHYDTQHYDTQHYDTQHYDTQHSITTLTIMGLFATHSINDTQHKCYSAFSIEYRYAECHYAECLDYLNIMLYTITK